MVLASALELQRGAGLLTSNIEHSSILKHAQSLELRAVPVHYLRSSPAGTVSVDSSANALAALNSALVSVQWVNNETGVIQPIEEISELCKQTGTPFHTDAAQAVGKLPINVSRLNIDYLTFTAHKFHGPPGIGVVYVREPSSLSPLLFGGDQEGGLRPGTENLPGIIGAGVAAELRDKRLFEVQSSLRRLRNRLESELCATYPMIKINGAESTRVCNTTNLQFNGLDGQALVAQFDASGIRCSQSSACTNLRPEASYVLRAMGLSEEEAYASVRFSLSEENTADELELALERMRPIIGRLTTLLT